ncbi:MAG: hypothetical protein IAE95_13000 [Chitinophagaceae bacterium]|nr:hypothetical protein [Chitinophagaceae bacterium]
MRTVLVKTIVMQFYRINSGFFLTVFILLFGLMNGKAVIDMHHQIMLGISSSLSFFAGASLVWIAYTIKCINFTTRTLKDPSGAFLYTMQTLGNKQQKALFIMLQFLLMAPLTVYGTIAVSVGYFHGNILYPTLYLILQVTLFAAGIIPLHTINNTWNERRVTFSLPHRKFNFGQRWYLLLYSINDRKTTFFGLKLLSLLLLQAMVAANRTEPNRESFSFLILFLIAAHAMLPAYYVRFSEQQMSFRRNMPVSRSHHLANYLFTFGVIFLPEILFLSINVHHALTTQVICSLYTSAIAVSLLYTSLQYLPKLTTERYITYVAIAFFSSLLFVASFGLWWFTLLALTLAVSIFLTKYYAYEPTIE